MDDQHSEREQRQHPTFHEQAGVEEDVYDGDNHVDYDPILISSSSLPAPVNFKRHDDDDENNNDNGSVGDTEAGAIAANYWELEDLHEYSDRCREEEEKEKNDQGRMNPNDYGSTFYPNNHMDQDNNTGASVDLLALSSHTVENDRGSTKSSSPGANPLSRLPPPPPTTTTTELVEVIDNNDDDDDNDDHGDGEVTTTTLRSDGSHIPANGLSKSLSRKRPRLLAELSEQSRATAAVAAVAPLIASALASFQGRDRHMPSWMQQLSSSSSSPSVTTTRPTGLQQQQQRQQQSWVVQPGHSIPALQAATAAASFVPSPLTKQVPSPSTQSLPGAPIYINNPVGFQATWDALFPSSSLLSSSSSSQQQQPPKQRHKKYQLSILNINEFTITGLPPRSDEQPTPVEGLRVPIKQISREHGKAVYERYTGNNGDENDGNTTTTTSSSSTRPPMDGKWRIPLGAYQAFYSYLSSDPYTRVEGIPQHQLQIASLERARQERGYPTAETLVELGLPTGLAHALAPFQRGGVDFCISKGGRAMIADEMGLGKSIQATACMAIYRTEWPLLVLCPSTARYHWENEFQQWLGVESETNQVPPANGSAAHNSDKDPLSTANTDAFLHRSQVHVLTSSKDPILPDENTRVVICSYGLIASLIESGKIVAGQFRCAIVDESHMLKNKTAKRTSLLLPILSATTRCVLLSGTPALARPAELWPQLVVLGAEKYGWWDNEAEFIDKYVKNGGPQQRAELHTMLTGTVMIRRLKSDMLKSLRRKVREKAELRLLSAEQRQEFKKCLAELRRSKATLGNLARRHHAEFGVDDAPQDDFWFPDQSVDVAQPVKSASVASREQETAAALDASEAAIHAAAQQQFLEGRLRIQDAIAQASRQLTEEQLASLHHELEGRLRADIENDVREKIHRTREYHESVAAEDADDAPANETDTQRTTVLNRLYTMTGK